MSPVYQRKRAGLSFAAHLSGDRMGEQGRKEWKTFIQELWFFSVTKGARLALQQRLRWTIKIRK